ncbi:hypothetical protein B0H11DRAFT_2298758 [Mycena galericulata]|nr:hypothetical protein B0H11DRAFT_2298758 [Mycena galericulata]
MPTKRAYVDDTVRVVRTLPKGYDFVPPHAPLTYPASYHLIPAGPQNAPRKKRAVFQTLTNFTGRVRLPKRKEPEADLADESFSCCVGLQVTVLRDAVGRKCLTDALDLAIRWWRGLSCISGWALFRHGDTYGGESGSLVGSARMSRWSANTSSASPFGRHDGPMAIGRSRIWALGDHGFRGIMMAFFQSFELEFGLRGIIY